MSAQPKRKAVRRTGVPAPKFNKQNQRMGSKGERTRKLLIDRTVTLLETHGLRDVTVADVARAADLSPGTFYVYFEGVPEVVLAALESASQTSPELEAIVARDWLKPGSMANAPAFVEAYTELWNRQRTIFRVRNLAAEEGDERFYRARMTAAFPLLKALSAQVARAQAARRTPATLSARSCAGTILMMLERLAAVGPITQKSDGIDYASLKDAAAYTVAYMLGARS